MTEPYRKAPKWFTDTCYMICALCVFAGVCLFGYQCLGWLKTGEWAGYTGADGFRYFGMDPQEVKWIGLRRILVWVTNLPLAIWLIFAPFLVTSFVVWMIEDDLNTPKTSK